MGNQTHQEKQFESAMPSFDEKQDKNESYDWLFTPLDPVEKKEIEDAHVITQAHFSCKNCASDLVYSPSTQDLVCRSCDHHYPVDTHYEPIKEYDFNEALKELGRLKQKDPDGVIDDEFFEAIKCPSCGAEFSFKPYEHAGECPYCETPVIANPDSARFIEPRSLLPFKFEKKEAIEIFDEWMSSRWFAPSKLKSHTSREEKLVGIFLPYWTYDSQTYNQYRGQRGTTYYDRQTYSTVVNGKHVRRTRTVPRIRWTPVSGHVDLHFDDVLIGASKTLPRTIINHLHPWDLDQLVPYSEEYISGFRSELYQVTVDQGFLQAENIMEHKIKQSIRNDIGGDQQRISAVNTQHDDTTFKHVLLPVWSAAFDYRGKTYRYVINGRNGTIQGERPYSYIKIGIAVFFAIVTAIALLYVMQVNGVFDNINNTHFSSPSLQFNFSY